MNASATEALRASGKISQTQIVTEIKDISRPSRQGVAYEIKDIETGLENTLGIFEPVNADGSAGDVGLPDAVGSTGYNPSDFSIDYAEYRSYYIDNPQITTRERQSLDILLEKYAREAYDDDESESTKTAEQVFNKALEKYTNN